MTTDYSNNIANTAANMQTDNYSNKMNNNGGQNDNAFSDALNDASKNYSDKSAHTPSNQPATSSNSYAERTKDAHSANSSNEDSVKKAHEHRQAETAPPKTESTDTSEETAVAAEETTKPKEKTVSDENTENSGNEATEEKPQVDNAVMSAIVNEQIVSNIATEEVKPVQATTTEVETTNKDTTTTSTQITAKADKISDIDLSKIIDNLTAQADDNQAAQTTTQTTEQASLSLKKPVQPVETIIENLKMEQNDKNTFAPVEDNAPEVKVENTDKNSTKILSEQEAAKKINQNLVKDNSQFVVTVEGEAKPATVLPDDTVKVSTKDTEKVQEPVIKVTDSVAATVKESTKSAILENKETASNTKDRAVSQMTAVQNTDTTVTSTQTETNTDSDGTLSQNANELAAKLNVKDGSAQNVTGAESFINRLDQSLSAHKASPTTTLQPQELSKGDILSQTNKLFEDLQNTNNSKVSIVLKPENLGRVSLEIMNTKEGIVAKMSTDSQQVKELFDKNIDALKTNLSSQGVNVNNIKVECTQESANNAMNFERDQFNQNASKDSNQSRQQSTQNTENSYLSSSDADTEFPQNSEYRNEETIIKHDGKVDYKV